MIADAPPGHARYPPRCPWSVGFGASGGAVGRAARDRAGSVETVTGTEDTGAGGHEGRGPEVETAASPQARRRRADTRFAHGTAPPDPARRRTPGAAAARPRRPPSPDAAPPACRARPASAPPSRRACRLAAPAGMGCPGGRRPGRQPPAGCRAPCPPLDPGRHRPYAAAGPGAAAVPASAARVGPPPSPGRSAAPGPAPRPARGGSGAYLLVEVVFLLASALLAVRVLAGGAPSLGVGCSPRAARAHGLRGRRWPLLITRLRGNGPRVDLGLHVVVARRRARPGVRLRRAVRHASRRPCSTSRSSGRTRRRRSARSSAASGPARRSPC